jgi:hypothetical protein
MTGKAAPSGTREHRSWRAMLSRCENPKAAAYERYGGRGIAVCERWQSFDAFLADMGARPEGTSLDRINNDGGYEPGNCRWATISEQMRNTRQTRLLTHEGVTMCLGDWAERLGLSRGGLEHRLERMPLAEALSRPVETHATYGASVSVDGVPMSRPAAAVILNRSRTGLDKVARKFGRDLTTAQHRKKGALLADQPEQKGSDDAT